MHCNICGKKIKNNQSLCDECQKKREDIIKNKINNEQINNEYPLNHLDQAVSDDEINDAKNVNNKKIYISIVIIVLGIIALLLFLLGNNNSSNNILLCIPIIYAAFLFSFKIGLLIPLPFSILGFVVRKKYPKFSRFCFFVAIFVFVYAVIFFYTVLNKTHCF